MKAKDVLPPDPTAVHCSECDREVSEFEAVAEHWTFWSEDTGDLHPYCPACAARGGALGRVMSVEVV